MVRYHDNPFAVSGMWDSPEGESVSYKVFIRKERKILTVIQDFFFMWVGLLSTKGIYIF